MSINRCTCGQPATSEINTLRERLRLCARCADTWWRAFLGARS